MAIFASNIVVCPECGHKFAHNKVNGIALAEAASNISSRKKMYTRLSLDDIERVADRGELTYPFIRKIILDNFSDFTRDVHSIIGWGEDAE